MATAVRKTRAKAKKQPPKAQTAPVHAGGTTFVAFVLDETGSMSVCRDATISGFNEYLQTLKKQPDRVKFTLTLFNSDETKVRYKAVDLNDVKPLNYDTYHPSAMTPLYDAIAKSVRAMESEVSNHTPAPAVLCVIMTDGEENASQEFTHKKIRDLISKKEKDGWNFIYLGANQDAWATGAAIGVSVSNTMNYDPNKTQKVAAFAGHVTNSYRSSSGGSSMHAPDLVQCNLTDPAFKDLDEDDKKKTYQKP